MRSSAQIEGQFRGEFLQLGPVHRHHDSLYGTQAQFDLPGGVQFQDESEYGPMCTDRASKGYNSGMGEIFRKVASISPVVVRLQLSASEVGAAASPRALSEGADANESCESPNSEA